MDPVSRPRTGWPRRRRTIAVAGTAFGAAIGLSLMYVPRVLDVTYYRNGGGPGGGWCGVRQGPPWCLQNLKIVAFDRPVVEGTFPEDEGRAIIRKWQLRVAAVFGLVGGLIGGLVGSHRFWSSGPPPRLRAWLALHVSAGVFGVLVAHGPPWAEGSSLGVRLIEWHNFPRSGQPMPPGETVAEVLGLAVLAAMVGVAGTMVITSWRMLLPPWNPPDQAEDYADLPAPAQSPAGRPNYRERLGK